MENNDENENGGESVTIESEPARATAQALSPSVSYVSAFAKSHLDFAKQARNSAGEIEAIFGDDDKGRISKSKNRGYQRNILSAVIHSIAFLEGQKHWFRLTKPSDEWDFAPSIDEMDVNWDNHLEDAFADILDECAKDGDYLRDATVFKEVATLRKFRNEIIHFKSHKVSSGEEVEYYSAESELKELEYPKSKIGAASAYPYMRLSYEMSERSVRNCFHLWRLFARKMEKEEELMKGVPSP